MNEKGLLCNERTVLAIQARKQTQDRRPLKRQPDYIDSLPSTALPGEVAIVDGVVWVCSQYSQRLPDAIKWRYLPSPFGIPGTRLYVRETWKACGSSLPPQQTLVRYKADNDTAWLESPDPPKTCSGPWRPSIHMPRWASRINLLVKRVWVELVKDISDADARAEGLIITEANKAVYGRFKYYHPKTTMTLYQSAFFELWESIYGPGKDWAWAAEFELENS